MSRKLLLPVLFVFLLLSFVAVFFLVKSRKIIIPNKVQSLFTVDFVDEIGLEGISFDKTVFANIADRFEIVQSGAVDLQNSDSEKEIVKPNKVIVKLTDEEQRYFKTKGILDGSSDLVTIVSFGQEYSEEDNVLTVKVYASKQYLTQLESQKNISNSLNYQLVLGLYKMSTLYDVSASGDAELKEAGEKLNSFITQILEEEGQIFTPDTPFSSRIILLLSNFSLVKPANAQFCAGIVYCGVITNLLKCSSTGTVNTCTIVVGELCDNGYGVCQPEQVCDFGDDVNIYCPWRTTQSLCTGGAGRCVNPPYDCTDPNYQSSCQWIPGSTPPPTGGGTPPPGNDCIVDLTPNSTTVSSGASTTFTASVTVNSGTVDSVDFVSGNTSIATVNPASDTTPVYSTQVTGQGIGSTTVRADVVMGGSVTCTNTSTIDVITAGAWWQVIDADLTTNGNITSTIPATCSGACTPNLILDGAGGYPGVAAYGGTLNTGSGGTSSTNWSANTTFNDKRTYNYAWFSKLVPNDVTFNEITSPSITNADIASGGTLSRDFYWYHFDGATLGDLTVSGNVTIPTGRNVVVFVEGANLYLQGDVNIQTKGDGFIMFIVGKTSTGSKGDIFVDSTVGGAADGVPEIEGLYLAESEFYTGAGTSQLHVRGSIASYEGISLQRSLADNSVTPAELFEFAPELLLQFPTRLKLQRIRWEEVAP